MDETRIRILNAAEELFATHGVAAVTMRSIAASAGANIAAVNYHFGSKEKLFEEMFLRRVVPLNDHRLMLLDRAYADRAPLPPDLSDIVRAYAAPALRLVEHSAPSGRAIIVQFLLGRILAMPSVNEKLTQYYDLVRIRFVAALRAAIPSLSEEDAIWRYYWIGGAIMNTVALAPSNPSGSFPDGSSVTVTESLVTFFTGALSGDAPGQLELSRIGASLL